MTIPYEAINKSVDASNLLIYHLYTNKNICISNINEILFISTLVMVNIISCRSLLFPQLLCPNGNKNYLYTYNSIQCSTEEEWCCQVYSVISFLSSRDHPFLFISLSLPSFYISISSAILLSIMDLLEFMTVFQKKASLAPLRLAYHMDRNRAPKNLWTYAYHVYLCL